MLSAKCRPFCSGLIVLNGVSGYFPSQYLRKYQTSGWIFRIGWWRRGKLFCASYQTYVVSLIFFFVFLLPIYGYICSGSCVFHGVYVVLIFTSLMIVQDFRAFFWVICLCVIYINGVLDYKNPLHLDVVDRYLRRMGDKTIPDEAPPSLESFFSPWVTGIDLPQSRCCGFFVSFTNKHK